METVQNIIHQFECPNPGRDKYLGAEYNASDQSIYFIPGSAKRVLKVFRTPEGFRLKTIGETDLQGQFKWLRCCKLKLEMNHPGVVYGVPCCASQVLRVDLQTDTVSVFGDLGALKWKWHGAVVSSRDHQIYCIPCNHAQVLKIDPYGDQLAYLGQSFNANLKWYGGLEAPNGCIYGIPNCASGVLKIIPETSEVIEFGDLSQAPYKWHGGVLGHDGLIYAVPSHCDRVLRIDPSSDRAELIGDNIPAGSYRPEGKYKYGGAVVGSNGCIYCLPSDADQVLKIDPVKEQVGFIGPKFFCHNKWQNGFLAQDHCIYAIPCNMDSVLKINCLTDEVSIIELSDSIKTGFDKWEGGIVDSQGVLWCAPQNSKHVISISPLGS